MGRVKIKKEAPFIDMTPMSDVMTLLLTFFMLTSTFVKNEPVKVVTPSSVSEIKVPATNVLSILVDKTGKVFMSLDNQGDLQMALGSMQDLYGVNLDTKQITKFVKASMFGVPMNQLAQFTSLKDSEMESELPNLGIPTDSVDGNHSEFQNWVLYAREACGSDMKIAIKADQATPYAIINRIMTELQDIRENRYNLLTSLKKLED